MAQPTLPFALPGLEIERVEESGDQITIFASATAARVCCPGCGHSTASVHSHYQRRPRDLPVRGKAVRLALRLRRFRCRNQACTRSIFVERLSNLVPVYAQRTTSLTAALQVIGFALGGEPGRRVAMALGLPIGADTLLRIIRDCQSPNTGRPTVVGVDDWAYRRGRVYGTIIVDLERHRVIDLLPDRTAETLALWLKSHPSVEVIARDRSGEYMRGIELGAPTAQQVTDRWHLLVNLREALERLLDRLREELTPLADAGSREIPGEISVKRLRHRAHQEEAIRYSQRLRRLEIYTHVHELRKRGWKVRRIVRQVKISPTTVYRYLAASRFPEWSSHPRLPSILDPYLPYLVERWKAGCRNASQLWREICASGYLGTPKQVHRWVYERREYPDKRTPKKYLERRPDHRDALHFANPRTPGQPTLPAARHSVWALLKARGMLSPDEKTLQRQLRRHAVVNRAYTLAQRFMKMIRRRRPRLFDEWLQACTRSHVPELSNLAAGLHQDYDAVRAAIRGIWSNGQTEGQVNRLKVLKRQMYGRAKFDLLRQRVLHAI